MNRAGHGGACIGIGHPWFTQQARRRDVLIVNVKGKLAQRVRKMCLICPSGDHRRVYLDVNIAIRNALWPSESDGHGPI